MSGHEIERFFGAKVPESWFGGRSRIEFDDDEILYVGFLAGGSVEEFRDSTRAARIAIANEAEARFRRKVSWGVERDGRTTLFTTQSTPVNTDLALSERAMLDTLIDAGVARNRGEALAWCVKLVRRNQAEWLGDLRTALVDAGPVPAEGPRAI